MNKHIRLAATFSVDAVEYASRANAILGIRDSGKTYTATLIAEQLFLISEGFFDQGATANSAFAELRARGNKIAVPSVYRECDKIAALGFLRKESKGYKAVEGMKVNVVEA